MSAINFAGRAIAGAIAIGFIIAACRAGRRIQREGEARQAEFLATTIPDPFAPPAADDNRPATDPHLAALFAEVTAGFDDEDDDSTWATGRNRGRGEQTKGD